MNLVMLLLMLVLTLLVCLLAILMIEDIMIEDLINSLQTLYFKHESMEKLPKHSPKLSFPIYGYEEGISVSADVDADFFAIQELGLYIVKTPRKSPKSSEPPVEDHPS